MVGSEKHDSSSGTGGEGSSAEVRGVSTQPSTESSSSSSSSGVSPDQEKVFQLSWVDVLGTIISDVTPTPEPSLVTNGAPILVIDYSRDFAFVTGLYRSMRSSVVELVRSPQASLRALAATTTSSPTLAHWLLLTSFVIRQCPSHYTVWSDRREMVLNPVAFWSAMRERVCLGQFQLPEGIDPNAQSATTLKEKYDDIAFRLEEVKSTWLPSKADIPPAVLEQLEHSRSDGGSSGTDAMVKEEVYVRALWHAIVWEMATVEPIGRMYSKNFQLWHHRKELILHGLNKTAEVELLRQGKPTGDEAARKKMLEALLLSKDAFLRHMQDRYGIDFGLLDDRVLCEEVIGNVDSKNYHVWIHRSGFIHAFSFLVAGPPKERWQADWLAFAEQCDAEGPEGEPAFVLNSHWQDSDSCVLQAPVPNSAPIRSEFIFTGQFIAEDCFNNSAWCHRMYLLREDVVGALLKTYAESRQGGTQAAATETAHLSKDELLRVLWCVCRSEVDYALQWAYIQPSNECAFVYARSVGELYQSAVLRMILHDVLVTQAGDSGDDAAALLTTTAQPLVTTVSMGLAMPQPQTDEAPDAADNTPAHDGERAAKLLIGIHNHLSWPEYRLTFALLRYQQDALHSIIVPRANGIQSDIDALLHELADMADKVKDLAELEQVRQDRLEKLYTNGNQFMLDNMHQARASLYHSCFAFLEQVWLLYWGTEKKKEVAAMRSAEMYARDGITEAILPAEAWGRNVKSARSMSEAALFLEKEAMALSLAKELRFDDTVRSKYWTKEVRTVMHREY